MTCLRIRIEKAKQKTNIYRYRPSALRFVRHIAVAVSQGTSDKSAGSKTYTQIEDIPAVSSKAVRTPDTACARMRFGNLSGRLLVQLIFLYLQNSFTKAENLQFYRDVDPEQSMGVNYEEMARLLEAKNHANIRDMNNNRLSQNVPWPYIEYLYYQRQKEKKILEALLRNPSLIDTLDLGETKERILIPRLPSNYQLRGDLTEINVPETSHPHTGIDPFSDRFDDYTNLKNPYAKHIFRNEKPHYVYPSSGNSWGPSTLSNPAENKNGERLAKLEEKFMEINNNRGNLNEDESSLIFQQNSPPFTFKFDKTNVDERDAFAVKPYDSRYYEQDESSAESLTINEKTTTEREKNVAPFLDFSNSDETNKKRLFDTEIEYSTENIRNDKFSLMKILSPEANRRSEDNSVVVSSSPIMTSDIYFIAIVAGCSAAAMFALVLISLTWCRLHRGAKAAADIEYPAYGVTGPNKDVSPSGDQRLAHSAQMYHFQHQKQQIIAMENRTAASRDPGSVSEAESDEENEEGDYTVYECPGLASAGEMEVKNPMFNDDATPATSPQIHKDEDHI